MIRPCERWKGYLPDQFYMKVEVRSRCFHSDLEYAVNTIIGECGGVPGSLETADFLEGLAKQLREKA